MTMRNYVSVGTLIRQETWPVDFFGTATFDFLDEIAYIKGDVFDDEIGTNIVLELESVGEHSFELPFGFSLVVGAGPISFHMFGDDDGFVAMVDASLVKLRLPRALFTPVVEGPDGYSEDPDPSHHVEIQFPVGVNFDNDNNFSLAWPAAEGRTALGLPQCMLGQTGIIISASDVLVRLSESEPLPASALEVGIGEDFRGLFIGRAQVILPEGMASAVPGADSVEFENCFIGTGGFTGELRVDPAGTPVGELFGTEFGFGSLTLGIQQNAITQFELAGSVTLGLFDDPLEVLIGIDLDGKILVRLADETGIVVLEQEGLFRFSVDKLEFELAGSVLTARTSGVFTPLFQPAGLSLNWPGIRLEELSFDSAGNVRVAGGWLDLGNQASLDLFGFGLEITRVGFGSSDGGRYWIGFNGSLQLSDGIRAGASVEGLRIWWGGDQPPSLTMAGIAIELEIPGALKLNGKIALTGAEFKGAVRVELPALSFVLAGEFVAGTLPNSNQKTFAVFLETQLPAGIPLGATGLALYGFAGLYAHNREPDKLPGEGWYRNENLEPGWFPRAPAGVTAVGEKWRGAAGRVGLGAGIILGTFPDNGYTFNGRILLVLIFPGPVIMLEGMANLFRKRSALGGEEPNFHALLVIDPGNSFQIGLDAQYKYGSGGELVDIRGSADTFFDFQDASKWYLNIGVDDPAARRIRARLFQLFDVNAYFMLNSRRLSTGAGASISKSWGFKHLSVTLGASIDTLTVVSWHPVHFTGGLAVQGKAELRAFSVSLGISVSSAIRGDVFEPFGLRGEFQASLNLPWPLPDFKATIVLEWKEDLTTPPSVPVPVREASLEHIKGRVAWPLARGKSLVSDDGEGGRFEFERPLNEAPMVPPDLSPPFAPELAAPRVPADAKLALTFTRPTDDPRLISQNPARVDPETVGDPSMKQGAYRVGYALDSLVLQKWAPGQEGAGGTLRWVTIAEGGDVPDEARRLFASWQPGVENPTEGRSEQSKLFVNALTPFDYTAEVSRAWQDWFEEENPNYPCPPARPEASARVYDKIGTILGDPYTFYTPPFTVDWGYGGDVVENEEVVSTLLGPIDRGILITSFLSIKPPPGVEDFYVRLGLPKQLVNAPSSFGVELVGPTSNPLVWEDGVTVTSFSSRSGETPLEQNQIALLPDDEGGLVVDQRVEIALPSLPIYAEVEVQIEGTGPTDYEIYSIDGLGVESTRRALGLGRTSTRFHGASGFKRVVIRRTGRYGSAPPARLRRVSRRFPATLTVYRSIGPSIDFIEPLEGLVHVRVPNAAQLQLSGPLEGGITVLELWLPLDQDELVRRTRSSLTRLTAEDPLFEPDGDYRLVVTSLRASTGTTSSSSTNAVLTSNHTFVHHAYFHVIGPPGVETPPAPVNSETDMSPLGDLRMYVEQTLPVSIPPEGGKLLLSKAFYRGYDPAVKFNEAYAELMYLLARRALTLRLFDVDDKPVQNVSGRVSIPIPSWERSRQHALKESVGRWVGMINQSPCQLGELPPFDEQTVVRNQIFAASGEQSILASETLYRARLTPALLHESFVNPLPGLIADGAEYRLERWVAENSGAGSRWHIDEELVDLPGGGSSTTYFVTESTGVPTSLVYTGSLGMAESPDSPTHWSDFRASSVVRWSAGTIGLEFRRSSSSDCLQIVMDRATGSRRLVSFVGGTATVLAEDTITFPDPGTDVFLEIDCVGTRVQVYVDDRELSVFDVNTAPVLSGTLGLFASGSDCRFSEIHVDDLRPTVSTAFAFDFVTSKYLNFYHHMHSFSDRPTARDGVQLLELADLSEHVDVSLGLPVTNGDGLGAVTEAEWRAFDRLEAKTLKSLALTPPSGLEVLRVSPPTVPLAILLRSPEPLLWERTLVAASAVGDNTDLGLPGTIKITSASFGATPAEESVTLLIRANANLARYRLEWRPLVGSGDPQLPWATYFEFGVTEPPTTDGTQVRIFAASSTEVSAEEPGVRHYHRETTAGSGVIHFESPGIELRLLAPDGRTTVHSRQFRHTGQFSNLPLRILRKLDGTAMLLFANPSEPASIPGTLRLEWTFTRVRANEDLPFRQSGNETPELVTLDLAF